AFEKRERRVRNISGRYATIPPGNILPDDLLLPEVNATAAPLVAHVIYRFDVGGLENGLVNLLNRMPPQRFRHAIVCLTDHSDFRDRLKRDDIDVFDLRKPPGNSPVTLYKLWRLFKRLRPDIVHKR